jgi:hypothetical protein
MDTYSHVLPSMQVEAMNKMNDLFRHGYQDYGMEGGEEME